MLGRGLPQPGLAIIRLTKTEEIRLQKLRNISDLKPQDHHIRGQLLLDHRQQDRKKIKTKYLLFLHNQTQTQTLSMELQIYHQL